VAIAPMLAGKAITNLPIAIGGISVIMPATKHPLKHYAAICSKCYVAILLDRVEQSVESRHQRSQAERQIMVAEPLFQRR